MTRCHRRLLLVPVLLGSAAPAAAQEMCAALDRIAAASRQRVPFASLVSAAQTGTLVPGYRGGDCTVRRTGVTCWRNLAPERLELGAMEQALRECLRREPLLRPGRQPRASGEADLVFVARGLRYEADTACSPRCAAGMLASFGVRFENQRRRR